MPELTGQVSITRGILNWKHFEERPFDPMHAWLDLLLLANQADTETVLHGEAVALKRGQLVRSIFNLHERWGRSREWVSAFLKQLQREGSVNLEITPRWCRITVNNYDRWNPPTAAAATPPLSATDSAADSTTAAATDSTQREKGSWKERGNPDGGAGTGGSKSNAGTGSAAAALAGKKNAPPALPPWREAEQLRAELAEHRGNVEGDGFDVRSTVEERAEAAKKRARLRQLAEVDRE